MSRGQFQTAALVLIVVSFIFALGGLVPGAMAAMAIGSLTTLLGLVVAYMWVVLWIKRLHQANTTGWMAILSIVYALGLNFILKNSTEENQYGPDPAENIEKVFE